jgi:hypothetical protein
MPKDNDDKDKVPNTLQDQAWKRAKENKRPKVATPYEWEEYEKQNGTSKTEQ